MNTFLRRFLLFVNRIKSYGVQAGRRYAKLVKFLEDKMQNAASEKVQIAASERLGEVLMHMDVIREKAADRAQRRELKLEPKPVPASQAPDAKELDALARELERAEADRDPFAF